MYIKNIAIFPFIYPWLYIYQLKMEQRVSTSSHCPKMSRVRTLPCCSLGAGVCGSSVLRMEPRSTNLICQTYQKHGNLNIHVIRINHLWDEIIWRLLWIYSLIHVPSTNMEGTAFMMTSGRYWCFGFTFGEQSCCQSLHTVHGIYIIYIYIK